MAHSVGQTPGAQVCLTIPLILATAPALPGLVFRYIRSKQDAGDLHAAHLARATHDRIGPFFGLVRMHELRTFLAQVGIAPERFFLLCVPDGSQTLPAMRDYFYRALGQPFVDPLLKIDRVPYTGAVQPGMPCFGEARLAALQGLLARLRPVLVLTHHPQDDHADHRAVSFFAQKACAGIDSPPALRAVLVYYRRFVWPPTGSYFYSEEIAGAFPGLVGEQFLLTEAKHALKRAASQVFVPTLSAAYIESNMKKDEVYGRK